MSDPGSGRRLTGRAARAHVSGMASETTATRTDANLDKGEVERFARLAAEWWSAEGKFRPLHKIGPARLTFLRDRLCAHFARDARGARPLAGLTILDIGCGGGLVAEPLARLGAHVTGIDPAADNIAAARAHAEGQGLALDYRAALVEDLVSEGRLYDAVLCLEVVEHVPDPAAFVATCARLVRPGGLLLLSTINRTWKAYALAIIGAEYVLRWLPAGTHRWDRFVTPAELEGYVKGAGLMLDQLAGMIYDPLTDRWSLGEDVGVNYLMSARKGVGAQ
jgi:2-polyprenyl-6-hydroxyphenyl methylase/3-demethylubiquinone-9 3-methyltransferase